MKRIKQAIRGPLCFENWLEFSKGAPRHAVFEAKLFSDAHVSGEARQIGPHDFLNTLASAAILRGTQRILVPSIVLRVAVYTVIYRDSPGKIETIADHYHGGDYTDEVAALASLVLGIRLKAGSIDREFQPDGDPLGTPTIYGFKTAPELSFRPGRIRIPAASGSAKLTDLNFLTKFSRLNAANATALIKAARLYQEALWIAEIDPHLSWLMFVSAIETAAQPQTKPGGAAEKFVSFICDLCPSPPQTRPPDPFQFSYEQRNLKSAMKKIYRYRSEALHKGTAFPAPMCNFPMDLNGNNLHEEIPLGLGTRTLGASWKVSDTPMLLHTFAHITRGALMKWADSLFA